MGWTSVVIQNSVTKIRRTAFWGCSGMHSVTIGNNVDSMMMQCMPWNNLQAVNYSAVNCKTSYLGGQSIFAGIGLTTFNIGAGVQSLPDYLISHCGNLHSVSFPNTVTSIGVGNFRQCGLSGDLSLPSSLTQIGSNAFAYCTGLTSIHFRNWWMQLYNNSFCKQFCYGHCLRRWYIYPRCNSNDFSISK